MMKTIPKTMAKMLGRLPLKQIERIETVAAPVLIAVAVVIGTAVSAVQIRREQKRRQRWALPLTVLGAVVLIGATLAIVEAVVAMQPHGVCTGGAITTNGTVTCRTAPGF